MRHSVKWLSQIHWRTTLEGTETKNGTRFPSFRQKENKCLGELARKATTHDMHHQIPHRSCSSVLEQELLHG